MSRSVWKGNYISKCFLKNSLDEKNNIKVWSRSSCVPYNMIDKSVLIYTGKDFKKIFVTREKVGYKFGEFCFTRNPKKKTGKKIKKHK